MYRVKPSKPVAVFGAFVGVAMLVFGITEFHGRNTPFLIFWCAVVVGITCLNLWSAFAKNGSSETITTADGNPPHLTGSTVTKSSR